MRRSKKEKCDESLLWDLVKDMKTLFGRIDVSSFLDAFRQNLRTLHRGAGDLVADIWSTSVVVSHCGTGAFTPRQLQLLRGCRHALCVKVYMDSRAPELFTKKDIIDTARKSVYSVFKRGRLPSSEDDVACIEGYVDNLKPRGRANSFRLFVMPIPGGTSDSKPATGG